MECIVHYTNQISYNKIKKLSDTNLEKINQAKLKNWSLAELLHTKSKWIIFLMLLIQIFMEYILIRVTTVESFYLLPYTSL